jgi:hypothetical protein
VRDRLHALDLAPGPSKQMPGDGDPVDLFPRMALGPGLRYKSLVEYPAHRYG